MKNFRNLTSRRTLLKMGLLLTGSGLVGLKTVRAFSTTTSNTPDLTEAEIQGIEKALGKKGKYNAKEVTHNTSFPRNDLAVTVKGKDVSISFGFGGWAAIKRTMDGKSAVLMSDCVLLQEEVNPLITAALESGLEVGAIHNHFFYEEPRIFYMHIHGMGEPVELAQKYATAISNTKIAVGNQPAPLNQKQDPGDKIFNVTELNNIIGHEAAINGSTIKYTVGRSDLKIMAMGAEMTSSIGLNSWASFTGSENEAYIAGDIAMLDHEVNQVISTLRKHLIEIVAIHNHMLGDDPHMIFLHYFGVGPSRELALAFRDALLVLGKKSHWHNH